MLRVLWHTHAFWTGAAMELCASHALCNNELLSEPFQPLKPYEVRMSRKGCLSKGRSRQSGLLMILELIRNDCSALNSSADVFLSGRGETSATLENQPFPRWQSHFYCHIPGSNNFDWIGWSFAWLAIINAAMTVRELVGRIYHSLADQASSVSL